MDREREGWEWEKKCKWVGLGIFLVENVYRIKKYDGVIINDNIICVDYKEIWSLVLR